MAAGADLGADGLGVLVVEQGPDHGGRLRRAGPREVIEFVPRDQVLRDEPTEATEIDFSDESLHGLVIACRPGVAKRVAEPVENLSPLPLVSVVVVRR